MQTQEFITLLGQVQFKQSLSWPTYLLIALFSGGAGFLASYLKEKGKNYANKEDFDLLKKQLVKNTELIEKVKATVTEKTWINQQVWVKKQEAYESIFESLLNVNKYVMRQVEDYEEWEYIDKYHPYYSSHYNKQHEEALRKQLEEDKKEYEKRVNSAESKETAKELKKKYDTSIEDILDIVEVKAIYLDSRVKAVIEKLKEELTTTHDEEDWDCHFNRLSKETREAINKIKNMSKDELNIEG